MTKRARQSLGRDLLRRGIESRVISMADERPLETLITHTREELQQALARVKEPTPPGYAEGFLAVQEKWKHSLNCWSAAPSIPARVLSNWYPIEEGIQSVRRDLRFDGTFLAGGEVSPGCDGGRGSGSCWKTMEHQDWGPWLTRLDDDPKVYLPNAYAVEFLRHNLTRERLRWFGEELTRQGVQDSRSMRG